MLKKSWFISLVLIFILMIGTGSAQQIAAYFNNALNSLYYYSQGIDRLIPGLKPLDTASSNLEKSISNGQAVDESLLLLALINDEQGNVQATKTAYENYLARNEAESWVYVFLADLDYKLGDMESALVNYHKALETEEYTTAYYGLGRIYSEQADPEAAITAFSKSVELSPGYREARLALAKEYYYDLQHELALAEFEVAYQYNPRNAEIHYYLWRLYSEQGDSEKAEHSKILAMKYDPAYAAIMTD